MYSNIILQQSTIKQLSKRVINVMQDVKQSILNQSLNKQLSTNVISMSSNES